MPLQTLGPAIDPTGRTPGSIRVDSQRVRNAQQDWNKDIANIAESLESRLDRVQGFLQAAPASLTDILATDPTGAVIGWFGVRTYGGQDYSPAWFQTLYIGGSGPDTGISLTANGSGTVTVGGTLLSVPPLVIAGHPGMTGDITLAGTVGIHVVGGIIYGTF